MDKPNGENGVFARLASAVSSPSMRESGLTIAAVIGGERAVVLGDPDSRFADITYAPVGHSAQAGPEDGDVYEYGTEDELLEMASFMAREAWLWSKGPAPQTGPARGGGAE